MNDWENLFARLNGLTNSQTSFLLTLTKDRVRFTIPAGFFYTENSFPASFVLDRDDTLVEAVLSTRQLIVRNSQTRDPIFESLKKQGVVSFLALGLGMELEDTTSIVISCRHEPTEQGEPPLDYRTTECKGFIGAVHTIFTGDGLLRFYQPTLVEPRMKPEAVSEGAIEPVPPGYVMGWMNEKVDKAVKDAVQPLENTIKTMWEDEEVDAAVKIAIQPYRKFIKTIKAVLFILIAEIVIVTILFLWKSVL